MCQFHFPMGTAAEQDCVCKQQQCLGKGGWGWAGSKLGLGEEKVSVFDGHISKFKVTRRCNRGRVLASDQAGGTEVHQCLSRDGKAETSQRRGSQGLLRCHGFPMALKSLSLRLMCSG